MKAGEIKRMTNRTGVDVVIEPVRFFFGSRLEPVIDCTSPPADAAAARAHRRQEESGRFGTMVLEVP